MVSVISFFGIVAVIVIAVNGLNLQEILDFKEPDVQEFSNLITKHHRRHRFKMDNEGEVKRRLGHFRKSKDLLKRFHNKHKNAKFRLNKFALMSKEEKQKHFGVVLSNRRPKSRATRSAINNVVEAFAPASFDFRTHGKVPPIKDQGTCGSCWAFSSAATVESQYLLRLNQSLDLSEQFLVNCNSEAHQCNGGNVIQALDFVKVNGIANETCQPYTAKGEACTTKCASKKYYIGGYHDFGMDESTFAKQLYNYGPATIIIYVPEEFMSYDTGILDMPESECMQGNLGLHAMVIVGYTEDYWIIRNSWDTDWGEQGYARIKRGQNFCSMNLEVVAPFLNVSTSGSVTTKVPTGTTKVPTTTAKLPTTTKSTTKVPTTTKVPSTTKVPTTTTTTKVPTTTKATTKAPSTTTPTPKPTTLKSATTTKTPTKTTTIPSTLSGCQGGNGISTMNDATRSYALKIFNAKRSELAKGMYKMSNGNYAPAGKNIKKLIYNCTLEESARKYADSCNKNYLPNTFNSALAFSKSINITNALDQSISHLFSFTVTPKSNNAMVSNDSAFFGYDDATAMGCAFSEKPCFSTSTMAFLVCAVGPIPASEDIPLYSIDSSCIFDKECTKPGYNKCEYSSRLCYS